MPVVSQSITRPMVPVGAITGGLRVAVAVLLAELERAVPGALGVLDQRGSGQALWSSGTGGVATFS